ncbi:MAG: hypothetical protein RQM92_12425 [Candidatus Syntrophopropionicum ammoniitolerans]
MKGLCFGSRGRMLATVIVLFLLVTAVLVNLTGCSSQSSGEVQKKRWLSSSWPIFSPVVTQLKKNWFNPEPRLLKRLLMDR